MTLQPTANRQEVMNDSGILGYEGSLVNGTPKEVQTNATGSGAVNDFSGRGQELAPGTTSGDKAQLIGLDGALSDNMREEVSRTFLLHVPSTVSTPTGDAFEFGFIAGNTGQAGGAKFDFTAGEFNVGDTTRSFDNTISGEPVALRVTINRNDVTTAFELSCETFQQTEVFDTFNYISGNTGLMSAAESNGNGETITVAYVRESIKPGWV